MINNKNLYININYSFIEKFNKQDALIYSLLIRNLTYRNEIFFSLNDICYLLKIKQSNTRMINKIKESVFKMNNRIFNININNKAIKNLKDMKLNIMYNATLINKVQGNSFKLFDYEVEKLLNFIKNKNIDKFDIFYYLIYLYSQTRNIQFNESNCFILEYDKIESKLKINKGNLQRYNKILRQVNLFYNEDLESYSLKNNNNSKIYNNLFYVSEINNDKTKEKMIFNYKNKNTDKIFIDKNTSEKIYFLEEDLENFLISNIYKIEKGMKFIDNQYKINDGRIDILARDKNNILCIIELKIVSNCKDLIFQCNYYPLQFNEKVRMITICPGYQDKIKMILSNMPNVEMFKYDVLNNNLETLKLTKII